jgi:hypothetical protein
MTLWEKFDFYEERSADGSYVGTHENYTVRTDAWRNVSIEKFDAEILAENRKRISVITLNELEGFALMQILQKIYLTKK